VVIAIIAILAAILFPVFARAREKAKQTSCLSNVKQLMLGVMMYAQDYDDMLCPGAWWYYGGTSQMTWYRAIGPYLKNDQILRCPSIPKSFLGYGWNQNDFGYSGDPDRGWCTCLSEIEHPATSILLGDNMDLDNPARPGREVYLYRRSGGEWPHDPPRLPARHNGGGNMGLCDGHAKWYPLSELSKAVVGVAEPWRSPYDPANHFPL
jgi:prepilin-type processing-associated H-X9-DG protein